MTAHHNSNLPSLNPVSHCNCWATLCQNILKASLGIYLYRQLNSIISPLSSLSISLFLSLPVCMSVPFPVNLSLCSISSCPLRTANGSRAATRIGAFVWPWAWPAASFRCRWLVVDGSGHVIRALSGTTDFFLLTKVIYDHLASQRLTMCLWTIQIIARIRWWRLEVLLDKGLHPALEWIVIVVNYAFVLKTIATPMIVSWEA